MANLEFAAGGIVYKKSRKGIHVGFILDPYKKWGFAKGHIERGEKAADAALREAGEEMGLAGLRLIASLGKIDLWFYKRFEGGRPLRGPKPFVHKAVHYFLMQAPSSAPSRPQYAEKIGAVRWVPIDEAVQVLSYKNMAPILRRALQLIKRRKMV